MGGQNKNKCSCFFKKATHYCHWLRHRKVPIQNNLKKKVSHLPHYLWIIKCIILSISLLLCMCFRVLIKAAIELAIKYNRQQCFESIEKTKFTRITTSRLSINLTFVYNYGSHVNLKERVATDWDYHHEQSFQNQTNDAFHFMWLCNADMLVYFSTVGASLYCAD